MSFTCKFSSINNMHTQYWVNYYINDCFHADSYHDVINEMRIVNA